MWGLTWCFGRVGAEGSCYYGLGVAAVGLVGGGELEEPGWFGDVEGAQDLSLAGGEFAALGDGAFGGGEGDEVEAFEVVADVAPGVADGDLGDAEE